MTMPEPDNANSNPPAAASWQMAQPVVFSLQTRLVFTNREPYKSGVLTLATGQPLRLRREPGNRHDPRAILVETLDGRPVGYLCAEVAGYLSILLDFDLELGDESCAAAIMTAAPPNDPAARRQRYPKLVLQIRLRLAQAWPLFTIAAVIGIKSGDFDRRFNLAGNPWLQPLQKLHDQYVRVGHDNFRLPMILTRAWVELTEGKHDSGKT